jgi:hypothetical protein
MTLCRAVLSQPSGEFIIGQSRRCSRSKRRVEHHIRGSQSRYLAAKARKKSIDGDSAT